jgi:hypothetical protein
MTSRNVTEIEDGDVFFVMVCSIFFSADSFVPIYINCWELMKSVGRHGSSSSGAVHDDEGDGLKLSEHDTYMVMTMHSFLLC